MILQLYKDNLTINVFTTLQNDWSSIDTIESWDKYIDFLLENEIVNDYKVLRAKIKGLVTAITGNDYINFSLLSDAEKMIAAKYLINKLPDVALVTIPNITEDILKKFGSDFNLNSVNARIKRLNKAKEATFVMFTRATILYLLAEINGGSYNFSLSTRYIDGIESFVEDGYDGLIDFINGIDSVGGTNDTLIIPINGVTRTQAKTLLLDIIINGIY